MNNIIGNSFVAESHNLRSGDFSLGPVIIIVSLVMTHLNLHNKLHRKLEHSFNYKITLMSSSLFHSNILSPG